MIKIFASQSIAKSYKNVLFISSKYLVQQNSRDQRIWTILKAVLAVDLVKINNKGYWEVKSINWSFTCEVSFISRMHLVC